MDNNSLILDSPDESGYYFYKKNRKSKNITVVYVNDDGVGVALGRNGEIETLDDLLGEWEAIEPQYLT